MGKATFLDPMALHCQSGEVSSSLPSFLPLDKLCTI
jgi:hypothetical protein